MKLDLVTRVLDGVPGVRKEGAAYLIPDDLEVSVFIGLPSEVLTVPRCARVEPSREQLARRLDARAARHRQHLRRQPDEHGDLEVVGDEVGRALLADAGDAIEHARDEVELHGGGFYSPLRGAAI